MTAGGGDKNLTHGSPLRLMVGGFRHLARSELCLFDQREIESGERAAQLLKAATFSERSHIDAREADVFRQSRNSCFACRSSPDMKRTVRGLVGEKSCIQSIATVLNSLTTGAPGACLATISLDVMPERSPRRNGLSLTKRLVASMRMRPVQ